MAASVRMVSRLGPAKNGAAIARARAARPRAWRAGPAHRHAHGIGHAHGTADQRDPGAKGREGRGDGMPLPPRGAVGDIPHRIDRLMRRPAGDQDMLAGQRLRPRQHRRDGRQDDGRLGQPPGAELVARHGPLIGTDDRNAASPQRGHVRLGGRMAPHPHIHRRRHQHRLVGGEKHGGGEVVGQPGRHLGQQVGTCRHHDQKISRPRKLDVPHLVLIGQREDILEHLVLADRLQRQRRHELRPALGQHTGHLAAGLTDQPDQLDRLERGNPAADDQQEALAEHAHNRHPPWIAAIPPARFCTRTRSNPALLIIAASVSWSGCIRMLSARY